MAALIVRSPTTLLWSQGTSKPSPAEDRLKPTHVRYPKRLGYFPALALSLGKNSDSIFHGSFLPRVAYQVFHNVYTESVVKKVHPNWEVVHDAYTESVVKKVYPNWEAVRCQEIDHVFEAVGRRVADVAVLPIEMCRYHLFDALLNQDLHIVGETNVTVKGHIGSDPFTLRTMRLDDPAAATDELLLVHEYTDIITGERMGQYYRKQRKDIVTPFIMLAKEPIFPVIDRPLKTSIVFSLDNCHPDEAFAKACLILGRRQIKVTRIKSRHQYEYWQERYRDSIWNNRIPEDIHNLIYVDFEASVVDQNLQNTLSDIQAFARFLRVLGSYNIGDAITLNVDETGAVS